MGDRLVANGRGGGTVHTGLFGFLLIPKSTGIVRDWTSLKRVTATRCKSNVSASNRLATTFDNQTSGKRQ